MPETICEYLTAVEEQIRWKRARLVVSLELRRHLEDQRDAFAAEGLEDAERLAVEEMGDPVAVGVELDRLHRPRSQWGLLGLTFAIALVGAFLRIWLTRGDGLSAVSPAATALALVLGTAALMGVYFLDISFLARHPRAIYVGALAAGVLSMWLLPKTNMASYYTRYVVLFYPVVYAVWLYNCRGTTWRRFALAIAGETPLAGICILAPYLFGLFLLLLSGLILLLYTVRQGWFGPEKWKRAGAAAALAVGLPSVVLGTGYWQHFIMRLRIALHPELDPLGSGYQGCMVKMLLQDVSLVRSEQGSSVLDRETVFIKGHLDFLPANMALKWGWLGYLLLMAVLAFLLVWLLIRCLRQKQQLGRLAALAAVLSLGMETLFSAALNLGFVVFSVHLPLVTGNLHTVLDMVLIGLVLSIFRGRDVLRDEISSEKGRPIFPWRLKISIVSTKNS